MTTRNETNNLRSLLTSRFLPFSLAFLVLFHCLMLTGAYQSPYSPVNYTEPQILNDNRLWKNPEGWPFVNWFVVHLHPDATFPASLCFIEWPGLIANAVFSVTITVCTYLFFDGLRNSSFRFQVTLLDCASFMLTLSIPLALVVQSRQFDLNLISHLNLMRSTELPEFQCLAWMSVFHCDNST